MKGQVGKWGNSLAIRLPRELTEELQIDCKTTLDLNIEKGKIVLEIVNEKPEFTLEELLRDYPDTPETEVDWSCAVGNEAW
jgi:antitoxin MazE